MLIQGHTCFLNFFIKAIFSYNIFWLLFPLLPFLLDPLHQTSNLCRKQTGWKTNRIQTSQRKRQNTWNTYKHTKPRKPQYTSKRTVGKRKGPNNTISDKKYTVLLLSSLCVGHAPLFKGSTNLGNTCHLEQASQLGMGTHVYSTL